MCWCVVFVLLFGFVSVSIVLVFSSGFVGSGLLVWFVVVCFCCVWLFLVCWFSLVGCLLFYCDCGVFCVFGVVWLWCCCRCCIVFGFLLVFGCVWLGLVWFSSVCDVLVGSGCCVWWLGLFRYRWLCGWLVCLCCFIVVWLGLFVIVCLCSVYFVGNSFVFVWVVCFVLFCCLVCDSVCLGVRLGMFLSLVCWWFMGWR